jgi:hypothetical protein
VKPFVKSNKNDFIDAEAIAGSGANSKNSTPYGRGKEARVASFPPFLHIEG